MRGAIFSMALSACLLLVHAPAALSAEGVPLPAVPLHWDGLDRLHTLFPSLKVEPAMCKGVGESCTQDSDCCSGGCDTFPNGDMKCI